MTTLAPCVEAPFDAQDVVKILDWMTAILIGKKHQYLSVLVVMDIMDISAAYGCGLYINIKTLEQKRPVKKKHSCLKTKKMLTL